MNIETELIHKWGIGDDPVFGSGSLKDIQTLCNECDKLRKQNEILRAEVELLEKGIKFEPKRECSICKGNGFIDVEKYDRVEQEDCRWCGTTGIEPQPQEALAEIERLQAENNALRSENIRLLANDLSRFERDQLKALTAEVERLKAALNGVDVPAIPSRLPPRFTEAGNCKAETGSAHQTPQTKGK